MLQKIFLIFSCFLPFGAIAQVNHGKVKPNSIIKVGDNTISFGGSEAMPMFGKNLKTIPLPEYLNGDKIYSENNVATKPRFLTSKFSFTNYIFNKLKPEFDKLDDGTYTLPLGSLVINEKGKLVYFDYFYLRKLTSNASEVNSKTQLKSPVVGNENNDNKAVPEELTNDIYNKLYRVLSENLKFSPALSKDGQHVSCLLGEEDHLDGFIIVKNHVSLYRSLGN